MPTLTPNYNLIKPAGTDSPPDLTALNSNWDIIDAALKSIGSRYFVDAQASDSYSISVAGVTDYAQLVGVPIMVKCNTLNTAACTLNVNALGAKNICRGVNTALVTGDILAGQVICIVYDGTQFQLKSQGADVSYASKTETLTGKTLTAPKMTSASSINDSGGNELIKFPATVGSAVNEITVNNAATGVAPSVEATGGDGVIPLNLKSKGGAPVQANGKEVAQKYPETILVTASRALALSDAGNNLNCSSASEIVITIPLNATVAMPLNTEIGTIRSGAGVVRFVKESAGITLIILDAAKLAIKSGGTAFLIQVSANVWVLAGALE